jgi:hypothetical protein
MLIPGLSLCKKTLLALVNPLDRKLNAGPNSLFNGTEL